jgi:D-alanine-D-alanine ligase-like ATP-grasp enzyme
MVVSSPQEAVQALEALGGPVVIKPRNGNHGGGVTVSVSTAQQAADAYAQASAAGAGVLVEAFVPGLDYRVLVVDGQVVAAAELRPAAVTGDGSRNIGQLIELANADPRRGPGHARELTRITLDAAAIGHTPERQPVDRRHQPGCHRSGPRPGRRDRAAAAGRLAQPMEPRPLISARAITVRRMSLVPSPITISGASR